MTIHEQVLALAAKFTPQEQAAIAALLMAIGFGQKS